jgi:alkanesulfonate monooxygenase SsuD/methylene tetrahydromethanopterin reductase-like flavin-dependent oxidoreductase (luciferase family)
VTDVDAAPLRFGLLVPTLMDTEPCGLARLAEAAVIGDEYPFETLWVGDHLLFHTPILESTVAITVLATMTRRVNVGTNVLQLPLRRPLDVAKTFASISHLSGGRVIMGIGVGGEFEPEWQAAGVSPRERGARCDEALDFLHWYWQGKQVDGRFAVSPGVPITPGPVGGQVPVWVGGRGAAAIRRAARCDGSLNMWVSPHRYAEIRAEILRRRAGRDGFTFGLELLTCIDDDREAARQETRRALERFRLDPDATERYTAFGPPADVAEYVARYARAGVQHVSFYLPGFGWSEQARRLATEVLPLLEGRGRG